MINEPGRFQDKGVAFLGAPGLRSRNAFTLELTTHLGHDFSPNKRWQLLKLNPGVSREGSGRKEEEEEAHRFFSLGLIVCQWDTSWLEESGRYKSKMLSEFYHGIKDETKHKQTNKQKSVLLKSVHPSRPNRRRMNVILKPKTTLHKLGISLKAIYYYHF